MTTRRSERGSPLLGAEALSARSARIEVRLGTRSRLEHEPEDRSSLLSDATSFDLPRSREERGED
jgi:hypothetical protein